MSRVRIFCYTFNMDAPRKDRVKISVIAMDLRAGIRDAMLIAHQIIPLDLERQRIDLNIISVEEVKYG